MLAKKRLRRHFNQGYESSISSVSDIIQMLAMFLIKSAATEWDQEHFTQFPKPWLFSVEGIFAICVLLVKHFS